MTDLTEQWKKGELPDGEDYYIKWKDSEVFTATFVDFMGRKMFQRMELEFEELPIEHYLSVLAPVPSYEEWEQLQNWADFTNDYHELREKLEIAEYENAMLKELLKECKQWFDWYHIDTTTGKEYIESWHKKGYEIHKKIDEALR